MRPLITGGAGYVGFSLVRSLAKRDDVERITVVDNLARRNWALFVSGSHGPAPVDFRKIDILDGYSLDAAMDGIDTVFHLAAHASTPHADRDHHVFDQVNNWGTAQVARAIEKAPSVRDIVYLSSFAVYGDSPDAITADTAPMPSSSYGISKLAGEEHLRRLKDRNVHIVRAGNVFGFNPAIRFDAVINALCFDAWTERSIRITGDGSQRRPFIHVDKLAGAVAALAGSDVVPGTYDLATHNASVDEIAEILHDQVPGLDRIYMNRDIRMHNLVMQLPSPLAIRLELMPTPLADQIASLIAALQG